ncbi:hypothetical protein BABINDRAFT_8238 [Babjeviella inositovora NRRL Y-12698]|uniref:NADP-dependent oxidoreductase domain-containing protein n=1 Tax=Babjeviella inositovora NRRL Y-12698 TaxID=984486 RepID=A0A1E3QT19_9ASCO|nr:uncharacterized protein BABINDRAFT_8238 [Babjeviella inositovora NRRL Y-12698]ODQ80067.1 hypothetical protein BABINDRAFT_8238 [Babjeviella inositovora NRRL Y-12698]
MESFAETNNLSELVEAFIDRNSTSKLLEEFVEKINVTQLLEHFSEPRIITNTPYDLGTSNKGKEKKQTNEAVITAVEAGCRHIYCARWYGTEFYIGQGIKDVIDRGIVTREELFITTKTENDGTPIRNKEGEFIIDKLGNYIQLYQRIEEIYRDTNKVRSIGVSNYTNEQLEVLLKVRKVKPVLNQVELNLRLSQKDVIAFNEKLGMVITAYSPLGGMGAPYLQLPLVKQLAELYGATGSEVLASYKVQRGNLNLVPLTKKELTALDQIGVDDPQLERMNPR